MCLNKIYGFCDVYSAFIRGKIRGRTCQLVHSMKELVPVAGEKQSYHEFYRIYGLAAPESRIKPESVVTEDSSPRSYGADLFRSGAAFSS
jgi:hypothetical protein